MQNNLSIAVIPGFFNLTFKGLKSGNKGEHFVSPGFFYLLRSSVNT